MVPPHPRRVFATFEGHGELVALNHDNPDVVDYTVDVMKHWLRRGADGWRLDAAYAVPDRFWAQVLPQVREEFGDAWFVGEVIHGDYSAHVRDAGVDSVTQYELWKAIWSSLNDGNFHELDHALARHNDFLDVFVPMTFIGNHDVTRIASKLENSRHLAHALVILLTSAARRACTQATSRPTAASRRSASAATMRCDPNSPHQGQVPTNRATTSSGCTSI